MNQKQEDKVVKELALVASRLREKHLSIFHLSIFEAVRDVLVKRRHCACDVCVGRLLRRWAK